MYKIGNISIAKVMRTRWITSLFFTTQTCKGLHLWQQLQLAGVARRRTFNLASFRTSVMIFLSATPQDTANFAIYPHTSAAPLGPSALAFFLPVAMERSSRNKYHSRYKRRLKMLKTRSWKSSGPFVGPKVRPRGK